MPVIRSVEMFKLITKNVHEYACGSRPCSFAGVLPWAFNPQGPFSLKAVILLSLHDCIVAPPVLSIERGFFLITQRKASHPL